MKKIISLILSICVLISTVIGIEINASADNEDLYEYIISSNKAFITGCDEDISGDIIIPSTLGGYPVVEIGEMAFQYCYGLTGVTIPNSVTTIRDEAFNNCENILFVNMGSGLTGIGVSAFGFCSGIKEVVLPEGLKVLGNSAFDSCGGIEKVTIPETVTEIGQCAFFGCNNLTDVYYGGTPKQWKAFLYAEGSKCLKNATVHCAKEDEAEPATEPNTEPATEPTTEPVTKPDSTTASNPTVNNEEPFSSVTSTVSHSETTNSPAVSTQKLKSASIKKAQAGKKQVKLSWKAVSGITGYKIQYSTDKKFRKGNKTITVKGAKKTSTTIEKLKSKKTYYIRIRTYKGKQYSAWSKTKTVKVK